MFFRSERCGFSPSPLKSSNPDSLNRSNIKITKSPDLKIKSISSKNNSSRISFDEVNKLRRQNHALKEQNIKIKTQLLNKKDSELSIPSKETEANINSLKNNGLQNPSSNQQLNFKLKEVGNKIINKLKLNNRLSNSILIDQNKQNKILTDIIQILYELEKEGINEYTPTKYQTNEKYTQYKTTKVNNILTNQIYLTGNNNVVISMASLSNSYIQQLQSIYLKVIDSCDGCESRIFNLQNKLSKIKTNKYQYPKKLSQNHAQKQCISRQVQTQYDGFFQSSTNQDRSRSNSLWINQKCNKYSINDTIKSLNSDLQKTQKQVQGLEFLNKQYQKQRLHLISQIEQVRQKQHNLNQQLINITRQRDSLFLKLQQSQRKRFKLKQTIEHSIIVDQQKTNKRILELEEQKQGLKYDNKILENMVIKVQKILQCNELQRDQLTNKLDNQIIINGGLRKQIETSNQTFKQLFNEINQTRQIFKNINIESQHIQLEGEQQVLTIIKTNSQFLYSQKMLSNQSNQLKQLNNILESQIFKLKQLLVNKNDIESQSSLNHKQKEYIQQLKSARLQNNLSMLEYLQLHRIKQSARTQNQYVMKIQNHIFDTVQII